MDNLAIGVRFQAKTKFILLRKHLQPAIQWLPKCFTRQLRGRNVTLSINLHLALRLSIIWAYLNSPRCLHDVHRDTCLSACSIGPLNDLHLQVQVGAEKRGHPYPIRVARKRDPNFWAEEGGTPEPDYEKNVFIYQLKCVKTRGKIM